jgi:hypothetical protein
VPARRRLRGSTDYHLFPEYGALEVVDDAGEPVGEGGRGTLVGTGFMNRVMPFLRYATDDRATRRTGPCPCGRAYPRVHGIEGRWLGERCSATAAAVFSMTALNTHSNVFDRVARFRIRQSEAGRADVLVVPGPSFGEADVAAIAGEYDRRAGGAIRFTVHVVPDLPLTGRGKFKFIEQLIPEDVQAPSREGIRGSMKQVLQNYKTGELRLAEVPQPALRAQGVLVATRASLISAGTEKMKVDVAKKSLLGKAMERPDQVRKVLDSVRQQGLLPTWEKVMNKLDTPTPLGYSSAGVVLDAGREAGEFKAGDRVACAGAGYAVHADVAYVPKNLVVPIASGTYVRPRPRSRRWARSRCRASARATSVWARTSS